VAKRRETIAKIFNVFVLEHAEVHLFLVLKVFAAGLICSPKKKVQQGGKLEKITYIPKALGYDKKCCSGV